MTDTATNNKRIAKNTVFMSLRMVVVLLITLYTSRVILDVLGVVDYGIYNVVAGFVTMFTFLNTSLSNGIQRFYNFELGRNGVDGAKKVSINGEKMDAVSLINNGYHYIKDLPYEALEHRNHIIQW